MKRDFTESAQQQLLTLVAQVEDEKLCDFTDWVGDRWYDFQAWIGKLDIKNHVDKVNEYHKKVIDKNNTTAEQINKIFEKVNAVSSEYKGRAETISESIRLLQRAVNRLSETINPSNGSFTNPGGYFLLRMDLMNYITNCRNLNEIAADRLPDENPAFDDKGTYGGDQGSAMRAYRDEDIQAIVKKYYPDYSDEQIRAFLEGMNNEGCGYVAMCNTLFAEFAGREDAFEEKFGFPMYKNGDLNYDALIVDFYCSKDDRTDSGTNWYEREDLWEEYMAEHDIGVNVVCGIKLTAENYEEVVKKGQIVVAISPVILEDEQGNIVDNREGGHAMTVTGVTEDGRFIVSSWGKKFYIDPDADYNRLQFQQVRY